MLSTTVIYRVIYSPTEFSYAHVMPGPGEPEVSFYDTAKRARLFAGDLPIEPIDSDTFEAATS